MALSLGVLWALAATGALGAVAMVRACRRHYETEREAQTEVQLLAAKPVVPPQPSPRHRHPLERSATSEPFKTPSWSLRDSLRTLKDGQGAHKAQRTRSGSDIGRIEAKAAAKTAPATGPKGKTSTTKLPASPSKPSGPAKTKKREPAQPRQVFPRGAPPARFDSPMVHQRCPSLPTSIKVKATNFLAPAIFIEEPQSPVSSEESPSPTHSMSSAI